MEEYLSFRIGFIEPLLMHEMFEIVDRKIIIQQIFGKSSPVNDHSYYKWCWDNKFHWCENCGKPLKEYSSKYISHINTRGAWTEFRYDPLNSNMLCFKCHSNWENLPIERKKKMYVYTINKEREYLWQTKQVKLNGSTQLH